MTKKARPPMSGLETDVMNVIWEHGEMTSRAVIERFTKQRKLADTTIRTVLTKLRDKGYVKLVPSVGRELIYAPAVQKDNVRKKVMTDIIGNLFDGSPKHAILHMIESEPMDDESLEEVQRLIREHKKKKRS